MLQSVVINGVKIIAQDFFLLALCRAHAELANAGIGFGTKMGFVPAGERTASWRSLSLQMELKNSGASKTLASNHRRGTAVDCVADWDYIKKIAPIMKKQGFVNDLAYWNPETGQISATQLPGFKAWDGGHWNWQSNSVAASFPLINQAVDIPKFTPLMAEKMKIVQLTQPGVAGSGGFALVKDGKKHAITPERAALAALSILCQDHLDLAGWDAIPSGEDF